MCFAKYDAILNLFAHFRLCVLGLRLIAMKEVQNYGKIAQATSKAVLKMAGGRMHTPQVPKHPLDPPLAISYKNHENSLAYFSHLAPLILLFFAKRQIESKGGEVWPNAPPKYVLLMLHIHAMQVISNTMLLVGYLLF